MKKVVRLVAVLFTVPFYIVSCNEIHSIIETEEIFTEGTDLLKFSILTCEGISCNPFLINDSTIHIHVPNHAKLDSSNVCFWHNGATMLMDGIEVIGNSLTCDLSDFTEPHLFTIVSSIGDTVTRKLVVYDLPVLLLDTPDSSSIDSKEIRKEGCFLKLVLNDGTIEDLGTAGVKGRGNSTWKRPKKPYNVKLDNKKRILGMGESKHWLLLSNPFYDLTQLHNDVAFEIARMTDYPWVQSGEYVELILNGTHQGLYYLCEKIGLESGKINIAKIKPSDISGDALTGGYLLEADIIKKENTFFQTDYYNTTGTDYAYPIIWNISEPDNNVPQEQASYIQNQFNYLESLIFNDDTLFGGEYRSVFDIENAINWWLVCNLCTQEEASRTKNMIVYKDRDSSEDGGRITIGPPWDFDAWTFDLNRTKQFLVEKNTWFFQRLLLDPAFVYRLKQKWDFYYPIWKSYIPGYIDKQYDYIHNSALRNRVLWPDWVYDDKSYEEFVTDMKEAFSVQLEWMNSAIHKM